ncbi:glycoside hydrolase family 13 protein [Lactobacillus sp. CC-MHH1034]|uniref:glycoside hydrolase family 13 protein n=1 Tax=Agrilactobacillus fermenti TaxID=2586909 RepID=UPI001E4F7F6D|nr:glycoside hydrolase family 13 protein [Agrilactobacillus fermenti]MCD2255485.1 glycoside hydrolase family 13 protein [Agrilactobacillus fermenti]
MIEYNSFLTTDKAPFGAVEPDKTVTFQIHISEIENIKQVALVVYQDEHWSGPKAVIPMTQTIENIYNGQFIPETGGLYFYFFMIELLDTDIYYGCQDGGYGGLGVTYHSREEVQMYQLTVVNTVDQVPDWYQDATFYHIFVDRFKNGNVDQHVNAPKANSFIYGRQTDLPMYIKNKAGEIVRWDFYGGNLKGIESQLTNLKAMGITALYLSPIFQARSNHRYDTGDYFKIDEVLGTLADFEHFLNAVHALDMHVILDGVFNHVGADSRYFNLYHTYETIGAANAQSSSYYDWFTFKHYPDDYESWWGVKDLPAINKDSQSFQKFIADGDQSVIGYWTNKGVDGWRLDVADELSDDFIRKIRQQLERHQPQQHVLIGEVWEDASNKVSYDHRRHYIEGGALQAVMNYPLRTLLLQLVNQQLSAAEFVTRIMTLKENYPRTVFFHNFNNIGSHDTQRVLTAVGADKAKLHQVFQLFYTLPGVPCLYYGDEAGLTGDVDPDNRRFYPWQHEDLEIKTWVQDLLQLRHNDPLFHNDADFYAFSCGSAFGFFRTNSIDGQYRLCVVNPTPNQGVLKPQLLNSVGLPKKLQTIAQAKLAGLQLQAYDFRILD